MTIETLFSLSAEEIAASYNDAVECIKKNKVSYSNLPMVFFNESEIEYGFTGIKKSSATESFEVADNGNITQMGFDRRFAI
jgi:hypothetical protein